MSLRAKTITIVILSLFTLGLAYLVWLQTKFLLISLGIMALFVLAVYLILSRA